MKRRATKHRVPRLHIHGCTIDTTTLTPKKYSAYSYTRDERARVLDIVSSARFKSWASQQSDGITAALIQDSHLWNAELLCKSMKWESSLLDLECGSKGLTVGDIILPRLHDRMVSMWETERRTSLLPVPRPYQGVFRHEHFIDNLSSGPNDLAPSAQSRQASRSTNLLLRLLYYLAKRVYNSTLATKFRLLILLIFLLLFFLGPKWCLKVLRSLWWLVLWPSLSWIWGQRAIFNSQEGNTISTSSTYSSTTSSHSTSPHTTSSVVPPVVILSSFTSSTPQTSSATSHTTFASTPVLPSPSSAPPDIVFALPTYSSRPSALRHPSPPRLVWNWATVAITIIIVIIIITVGAYWYDSVQRQSQNVNHHGDAQYSERAPTPQDTENAQRTNKRDVEVKNEPAPETPPRIKQEGAEMTELVNAARPAMGGGPVSTAQDAGDSRKAGSVTFANVKDGFDNHPKRAQEAGQNIETPPDDDVISTPLLNPEQKMLARLGIDSVDEIARQAPRFS